MFNPTTTQGGYGMTFASSTMDPALMNVRLQLEELNKAYTNNGPENIFKMPIYQLCGNPQDVNQAYSRLRQITKPNTRKFWMKITSACGGPATSSTQIRSRLPSDWREYSTDIFYGLDSIEKRQKEAKAKYDDFVKVLETIGTEINTTDSKLESDIAKK